MAAFVKFSRGLINQYNALRDHNKLDNDTLYLVYENTNSTTGQLYLGNKLISSTNISSINLSDISDINMPEELKDGMLLQYNQSTVPGESGRWEARPIADVLSNYEGSGGNSNIPVVDNLNNIENPSENDIAIQGTELFIYDGNQWQPLTVSDLEDRVSELEEKVGVEGNTGQVATGLYKKLEDLRSELQSQISSEIINAQHLRYKVVNNIGEIDLNDEEATQNTVFLVSKSQEDARENDGYDEYLVNAGQLEKIGSWDADLTNYVKTTDNRLLDDKQKQKLDSIGLDNNQAVITASQVSDLSQFIENNSKIKTVQSGVLDITPKGELQLVGIPTTVLNETVSPLIQSAIGDLSILGDNRYSDDSTVAEEIKHIKESIVWQELEKQALTQG